MKYLNILTACAGLAIAVPTLNPRQSGTYLIDKICKARKLNEATCVYFTDLCHEIGNTYFGPLQHCMKALLNPCDNDDDCGPGLECRQGISTPGQPSYICLKKKEQSQAGKQESASSIKEQTQDKKQESAFPAEEQIEENRIIGSASPAKEPTQDNKQDSTSPAKEPTQDNKQDSTSPAKNQTQAREQELASQQTEIHKIKKSCKKRGLTKGQCLAYRWYCKEGRGIVELDQLKHCVEVFGTPCKDDDQCGHGFKCYKEPSASHEDGVCDTKQSQAGEQESASAAKEPTQDNKQDSTSPEINETDKICETRQLTKDQCDNAKWYCKDIGGIMELDQLNHCMEVLGTPCKDNDQCGHGFACRKKASTPNKDGVCDTKQSQAGEQEPASPENNETDKICKSRNFDKTECDFFQQHCRKAGNVELDQLNNCLKVVKKPCKNDNECGGHGLQCFNPTINPNYLICLNKNQLTETRKQESASPANKPTQAGEQESASTTKEPTQAGEQESASSEQTQDKKQDSTSPAKEPTQDTTTNVPTPTKEPTQDTTTNVATPSRPCTKKPINSSEKSPVVGAKSTQA